MISDEEDQEDQDNYPNINSIQNNNLSHNLIKPSPIISHYESRSSCFSNPIKLVYSLTSISVSLTGLYIITIYYSLIQKYTIVYFYFFNYTFIWPIAIFITLIIANLYKLLYQPSNQVSHYQLTPEISAENKEIEIGSIMLMIFILLSYFISIPHSIMFILKLLKIQHLFIINDLYLFTAFLILNIVSSILFYLLTYISYHYKMNKRDETDSYNNNKDLNSTENKNNIIINRLNTNMIIQPDFLKKIELEVLQSQKISGIIEPNAELINKNNYFNKQAVSYINPLANSPNNLHDYLSSRSHVSNTSFNEEDFNAMDKKKRDQQKESMMKKIKLNILTEEEDEEDTRKNKLIAEMNKELKKSKYKDDDLILNSNRSSILKEPSFEVNDNKNKISLVKAHKCPLKYQMENIIDDNEDK